MAMRANDCPARGQAAFSSGPVWRKPAIVEPRGAEREGGRERRGDCVEPSSRCTLTRAARSKPLLNKGKLKSLREPRVLGAALEAGPASEPVRFRLEILVALAPGQELRPRRRYAKTSQHVLRHAASQLALAHHDEPGAVFLQVRNFGIAVCAHDR